MSKNSYTTWIENEEYYILGIDADGEPHGLEIDESLYLELQQFTRKDRNQKRSDERHIERLDLTEETLYDRAYSKPKNVVDTVIDRILVGQIWLIVQNLPKIQQRRFTLFYQDEYTYDEIAEMEKEREHALGNKKYTCSDSAVQQTIKIATKKVKEMLKELYDDFND